MSTQTSKPNRAPWIIFGGVGCLAWCLVIAIIGGGVAFLWAQISRPETQTEGTIPQPAVAITPQNIGQVKELYRIPLPGFVSDVAWSPDGQVLASASTNVNDKTGVVQLWDAVTGRKLRAFDQTRVTSLAFSPDGQMLAAGAEQVVIVWSVVDGRELSKVQFSYGAHHVAFSRDSKMLAVKSWKTVKLLEMPGGRELNTLQHSDNVMSLAFAPDGQSLITAIVTGQSYNETTFTVWEIASGRVTRTFTQPGGISNDKLVFALDGKSLSAPLGGGIRIWDIASGRQLQSFTGFRFGVPRFAVSPDGGVLAAGEGVGFEVASPSGLRLFDVASGREAPILKGHTDVIQSVAFSPNGRLLATASEDKTVRLWGVPPGDSTAKIVLIPIRLR